MPTVKTRTSNASALKKAKDTEKSQQEIMQQRIARAIEITEQMKALQEELSPIKDAMIMHFENTGTKKVITPLGRALLTVQNAYSVSPANHQELAKVFKTKISDMCIPKEYKLTDMLKNVLKSGDHKNIDLIRQNVTIRTSNQVKFERV